MNSEYQTKGEIETKPLLQKMDYRFYGGGEAYRVKNDLPLTETHSSVNANYVIKSLRHPSSSEVVEDLSFGHGLLGSKDLILNENYTSNSNICSQVIELDSNFVTCDCLVDKEQMVFETRTFPRILFDNIDTLVSGSYILLSIKSKPGTIKFDVYKGESFFDIKLFKKASKAEEIWNNLEKVDFDDPFDFQME